ncbi:endonuclease/exonuclease/phosphatase family protein [Amnibacterium flavum]|uniref:endonuclease/exonuclease/phosphatase family protein n=1 Tax=Amnibacterium flavum TaxID=2173173 RepID=UPI001F0BC9DB|nr:endonuclease/exonuclease/phosphatase family protein [Amnibacterium flavum]
MARFFAALIVLATGALLLAVFWPQLLGLQRAPVFAQAVSLRGAGAAVALVTALILTVVALLAAPARRFLGSLALLLLAFTVANVAVLTDRGFGSPGFETATDADITVLSWNTLGDAVSTDAIAQLAVETGADVVALPETTEQLADDVAAAARRQGLPLSAHTVAYDQVAKARSTSILISEDLGPYVFTGDATTSVLPSVVATSTTGGPTLVAVHAVAPIPSEIMNWRSDLFTLQSLCQNPNVILAGDFNSTLDAFAGLGGTVTLPDGRIVSTDLGSCRDAAEQTGSAAVGTWPTAIPAILGTPIDHVLASTNWRVSGFRVVGDRDGAGSDHRPVLAQLTPAV